MFDNLTHYLTLTNQKYFIMKNQILSVGSVFPEFKKQAVVSIEKGKEFYEISSEDHRN